MAVKTFTSEILTSSDTNTYLANSGLVYVTSGTWSAAATATLDNCYTSAYTNYRVLIWGIKLTSTADVRMTLRAGGTSSVVNYYMTNVFASGGSVTSNSENNVASFRLVYANSSNDYGMATFDIFRPQEAAGTLIIEQGSAWDGTAVINRSYTGFHDLATSYDGFQLSVAAGTIAGKYAVYGYRKP